MKRRQAHDRQIMKGPAQIIVLLEANTAVADLLRRPPVQGSLQAPPGLERRQTFQCFVERGPEDGKSILIAARKDTCSRLEVLKYDCHDDHRYRFQRRERMARTRIMVARITFKQNIGHIGKEVVVAGVHGSQMTMKIQWKIVWESFWDRLANFIRSHGVQFVAGDFNMSLTEVPKQLRSRGLSCDCVAWFPWVHQSIRAHRQALGFDSMGIFYIGGTVEVSLPWRLEDLDKLIAVAEDDFDSTRTSDSEEPWAPPL